jgi:hypothetical protein
MNWYKKAIKYDVFHGTRNQNSIYEKGFVYDYMGQGNDQYGPGFYFTTSNATADNYTKQGNEGISPGVIKAQINLKKPIKVDSSKTSSNIFEIFPKLNSSQVRRMINLAISLEGEGIIQDWGDVEIEGKDNVIRSMIKSYTGRSASIIMYDLLKNHIPQALKFITQETGYDGIIISHGSNIDPAKSNEKWVVAWYPEQIRIIR